MLCVYCGLMGPCVCGIFTSAHRLMQQPLSGMFLVLVQREAKREAMHWLVKASACSRVKGKASHESKKQKSPPSHVILAHCTIFQDPALSLSLAHSSRRSWMSGCKGSCRASQATWLLATLPETDAAGSSDEGCVGESQVGTSQEVQPGVKLPSSCPRPSALLRVAQLTDHQRDPWAAPEHLCCMGEGNLPSQSRIEKRALP